MAEVLLDRFVGDFGLTVGLGMVRCGFQVCGAQLLEQFLRQLGAELRSSVSDNVQGHAEAADPVGKDGFCHRGSFLIFQSDQLSVLREGVRHT